MNPDRQEGTDCTKLDWQTICSVAERLLIDGERDAAELVLGDRIVVPNLEAAMSVEDLIYRISPQKLPEVVVESDE